MSETKDGKIQRTIDGFDNFVSRLGLNNDNTLSAGTYTFNLMTRNRLQMEAAYRGSWVVGKVIDCIAEDMTKAGIDIQTSEDEKDLKEIYSEISKLRLWSSICDLKKWGRLYGGAISVLQIEGQDLATELDIETVGEGQFIGLAVYDRWQVNPVLNELIVSGPKIGLPAYYQIVTGWDSSSPQAPTATGQITVHHSRIIRDIGIKLPFFQAITEMMWGESILERLWDRLISFDSATMSTANLIERANNLTIGIEGLRDILAAGGEAQAGLESQFEMMRKMRTNEGITLVDKNDTSTATSYTFAGLSDVILQFGQQLAGAANTPLIRLFGQSPSGLSATGESDLRTYYDDINARQETDLREGWDLILRVLWQSVLGRPAPDDMEFTFNPLWQMSALDKSTIAKTLTDTVVAAEGAGIIDGPTAMKELRQASSETGLFSTITDEAIEEAEQEPELPPIPEEPPGKPVADTVLDSKHRSIIHRIKSWVGR